MTMASVLARGIVLEGCGDDGDDRDFVVDG